MERGSRIPMLDSVPKSGSTESVWLGCMFLQRELLNG
jgi:hypothetical protein